MFFYCILCFCTILIRARLCLWNDATPFVTKLVSVAVPLTKKLEGFYWQGVDIVVLNHRHLSNIDCSSFVMCPLLVLLVIGFFSFFFCCGHLQY